MVIADVVMWTCGQGDIMKIVAVICQKGGVGKTNLSIHLATAAALAGHRTAIVDLDPQGTASSWGDLRQADEPEVISGQAARLPMLIEAARANGADLIVIDTPPQADTIALTAAKVADIVLIPIRPAIWDLQAAQPSLLLAQVAQPAGVHRAQRRPAEQQCRQRSRGRIDRAGRPGRAGHAEAAGAITNMPFATAAPCRRPIRTKPPPRRWLNSTSGYAAMWTCPQADNPERQHK